MARLKVAVIGCGGRGRAQATGFAASPDAEIVACSDSFEEAATSFAEQFNVPQRYTDHQRMLAEVQPDIVCVATWTQLHLPMIRDAIDAGAKGVFAEKPMADNWADSQTIHRLAEAAGVPLAFCHQRRFLAQFEKAKELIEAGAIGTVTRLEGHCPNMIDWGTHWFDMINFLNGDRPANSVLGQVHVEEEVRTIFGVPVDNQGLAVVTFENDVQGLMITGFTPLGFKVYGEEGWMEVRLGKEEMWRIRYQHADAAGWQYPEITKYEENDYATTLAARDFVRCVKEGRESRLASRFALATTELVFAVYESARSRRRIDLPLRIADNPLRTMLEEGVIGPGDWRAPDLGEARRQPRPKTA